MKDQNIVQIPLEIIIKKDVIGFTLTRCDKSYWCRLHNYKINIIKIHSFKRYETNFKKEKIKRTRSL